MVVSDDGQQLCFRILDDAAPPEHPTTDGSDDVCIEQDLVSEPLAIGDCVTLRQGFPGMVVAGRANCVTG